MNDRIRAYVHSAAALGPHGDLLSEERKALTGDARGSDLGEKMSPFKGPELRRIAHFSELPIVASAEALHRMGKKWRKETALYLGTGLGESQGTIALFKDIMEEAKEFVSPYGFVNSVNNTAAFFIAKILEIESSNITISQEEFSFEWALKLAINDLKKDASNAALAGGVDELCHPRSSHEKRIRLEKKDLMGEGSGWLYLEKAKKGAKGEVLDVIAFPPSQGEWQEWVARSVTPWTGEAQEVVVLPGFRMKDEEIKRIAALLPGCRIENYLQYCGSFHTAAAFGIASIFDKKHERETLYIHINRDSTNRIMVIGVRAYAS
ncbi:MAG: hypothetical protein OEV42_20185 [Deltaproteobacteria bacterium]|nr:hypothetical protein [Deltaproteobacteria bacterium]